MEFRLLAQDPYVDWTDLMVTGTMEEFNTLKRWIAQNCKYYTSIGDDPKDLFWGDPPTRAFKSIVRFESKNEALLCKIALA